MRTDDREAANARAAVADTVGAPTAKEYDVTELVLVGLLAAVVFALGATAQAVSGFGGALASVPILALVIDPVSAVVAATGFGFVLTTGVWHRERAHVDVPLARSLIIPGVLAMPAGLMVLHYVSERTLTVLIAIMVVLAVVLMACRVQLPAGRRTQWGAGALSGALLTSTGFNGPPLVISVQSSGAQPRAGRATLQAVFSVQDLVAMVGFVAVGLLTPVAAAAIVGGVAGIPLGWVAGDRLFHRLSPEAFRRVVLVGLSVTALVCLGGAVLPG